MIYTWIFLICLLLYLGLTYSVYLFQKKFIFFPDVLDANYTFKFDQDYEEIWIKRTNRYELNGLHFKIPNPKCIQGRSHIA